MEEVKVEGGVRRFYFFWFWGRKFETGGKEEEEEEEEEKKKKKMVVAAGRYKNKSQWKNIIPNFTHQTRQIYKYPFNFISFHIKQLN